MVGLISFLFIFTKEMIDYAKENLGFSIVLDDGCSDKEVKRIENYLSQAPFVNPMSMSVKSKPWLTMSPIWVRTRLNS